MKQTRRGSQSPSSSEVAHENEMQGALARLAKKSAKRWMPRRLGETSGRPEGF